jgi:uncharacterized protein (DUF4415 family)
MANRLPKIDDAGEVQDLSKVEAGQFKPAHEVLPESLKRKLGVRGPQKAPTKERITIRLSPDVLEAFRATGEGWQSRIDEALKTYLSEHKAA